jgi:hypothetical protein
LPKFASFCCRSGHVRCGDIIDGGGIHVLPTSRYPYLVYWIIEKQRSMDRTHPRHAAEAVGRGRQITVPIWNQVGTMPRRWQASRRRTTYAGEGAMGGTAVILVANHRRLRRARAWLQCRTQAEEVLVVGATIDAANELSRTVAIEKGAAFGDNASSRDSYEIRHTSLPSERQSRSYCAHEVEPICCVPQPVRRARPLARLQVTRRVSS